MKNIQKQKFKYFRARLSRLATRYVHIVSHYRTPLYDRYLRDVAFIDPSRFKIKALCLPSCFDPGSRQFLGGQLHTYACTQHLGGPFVCEVQNSFAFIDLSETWFWLYVTFKTHLFASLDMPISKDVWKRLCIYLLLNLPERRLRNPILAKNLLDKRNQWLFINSISRTWKLLDNKN